MITVSENPTLNRKPLVNGGSFKSLSVSHQSKPIAISLRKSVQKQKILPRFEIEFSDFDYKFNLEIVEIKELSSNEIALYTRLEDNIIKISLLGDWQGNEGLYVKDFGFGIEKEGDTPISNFLLDTLWVMLGLSTKVKIQIPDFNQEATMLFDINLNTISEFLQTRQTAYRLMVIEKTFKVELPFPSKFIDGKDIEIIAYCYHSIVDRNFKWICPSATIPWTATQIYLSLLPDTNTPFPIQFGPEIVKKEIFGYLLNLGLQTFKIEEYVLDNFDEAKRKISKLDGREVLVQTRSKNGVMQIEALNTPSLPKNAFSHEIQTLIDLEEKLDSMYFGKYLDSFSDAFEDLTSEQIEAITERPTLEEEAFNF